MANVAAGDDIARVAVSGSVTDVDKGLPVYSFRFGIGHVAIRPAFFIVLGFILRKRLRAIAGLWFRICFLFWTLIRRWGRRTWVRYRDGKRNWDGDWYRNWYRYWNGYGTGYGHRDRRCRYGNWRRRYWGRRYGDGNGRRDGRRRRNRIRNGRCPGRRGEGLVVAGREGMPMRHPRWVPRNLLADTDRNYGATEKKKAQFRGA